jgi:hypothetical protein
VPAATARPGASARPAAPAISAAQARQVFAAYVAASAKAARLNDGRLALSVVTGVQRSVLAAVIGSHSVTLPAGPSTDANGAYSSSLTITPALGLYSYGPPAFYLPERAGYPRFFVAEAMGTVPGGQPGGGLATPAAKVTADGPVLMLFEQGGAADPWLLGSVSRLAPGAALPKLATDSAGYVPTVPLSDPALLIRPDYVGPLQAAVVDDGPASAAAKAVADGPLSTGMYASAVDHVGGLSAPRGDIYQWELQGSSLPRFALRTASGGALVFYAMTLNTTVAVPDVINKADPVRPGPVIQVPAAVQILLPTAQPAPRVQLSTGQTLSFAAIDPPSSAAKIQVIAIGGGLTSASASLPAAEGAARGWLRQILAWTHVPGATRVLMTRTATDRVVKVNRLPSQISPRVAAARAVAAAFSDSHAATRSAAVPPARASVQAPVSPEPELPTARTSLVSEAWAS